MRLQRARGDTRPVEYRAKNKACRQRKNLNKRKIKNQVSQSGKAIISNKRQQLVSSNNYREWRQEGMDGGYGRRAEALGQAFKQVQKTIQI